MSFESEFEKWKDTVFGPYCMTKCERTCCNMHNVSLYLRKDELIKLFGKKILNEDFESRGIKKAKANGMYYLDTDDFCPKFESKSGKCLDYVNRSKSCREFPFMVERDALMIKSGCALDDKAPEYKRLVEIAVMYKKVIVKHSGK